MADINHTWGDDILLSASGDLASVDGLELATQRIIRRLMTRGFQSAGINIPGESGEYIWHPEYGGGVPQRIGGAINVPLITSVVSSQIAQEASVAKSPPPQIAVTPYLNGVAVTIVYTDNGTGNQTKLSFNVNQ